MPFTDLQAAVTERKTVDASVITLLEGLSAKIAATAGNPAAVAALATEVRADAAAMAAAVVAHTPAEGGGGGGGGEPVPPRR